MDPRSLPSQDHAEVEPISFPASVLSKPCAMLNGAGGGERFGAGSKRPPSAPRLCVMTRPAVGWGWPRDLSGAYVSRPRRAAVGEALRRFPGGREDRSPTGSGGPGPRSPQIVGRRLGSTFDQIGSGVVRQNRPPRASPRVHPTPHAGIAIHHAGAAVIRQTSRLRQPATISPPCFGRGQRRGGLTRRPSVPSRR